MTELRIPRAFHDVLGERQTPASIAAVGAAMIAVPLALAVSAPSTFAGVDGWRGILALVLIADVAAGAVANLTAGTDDYYAARPRHRWVFIAVHVHLPVIAVLLALPLLPAVGLWAGTIAAAVVVNLLAGHPEQRVVAGALLVGLLAATALAATTAVLAAVAALFAFKVAYAFAVHHHPDTPEVR